MAVNGAFLSPLDSHARKSGLRSCFPGFSFVRYHVDVVAEAIGTNGRDHNRSVLSGYEIGERHIPGVVLLLMASVCVNRELLGHTEESIANECAAIMAKVIFLWNFL